MEADDTALFDWLRYYGALIILFSVLGATFGFIYTRVVPRRAEAWTLVVETGTGIGPRQLGPVSQALFHSSEVSRPAMQRLGISESPIQFYAQSVSLQPVPSTNTIIVVGMAGTLPRAQRISSAMASAFVQALRTRGFAHFHIFGGTQPAPVRSGISTKVAVIVAAVAGVWLGLAVAILHYRYRRPVLSLGQALALSGAETAVELEPWRPGWLGILRRRLRWKESRRNDAALQGFVAGTPRAQFVAPRVAVGERARLAERLGYGGGNGQIQHDAEEEATARWNEAVRVSTEPTVLLCDPGTRRRDLEMIGVVREHAGREAARVALVWVA